MNSKSITGGIMLLAILATTPARAAGPLQPTGKWNVDFGNAHCIALRNYGTSDTPLILALKPAPIGDIMQVSVLRKGGLKEVGQYDGSMFIDRLPATKVSILGYASGKSRVNAINMPVAAFEPVRNAASLRILSSGEVDQSFVLSDMAPVSRALDRCIAGLRKAWNIAGADTALRNPAKAVTPLPKLFSADDYPAVALRAEAGGTAGLVMLIDEAGKVESCMVSQTSGYASLDAQSCAIVTRRGRFEPAIGIDGKPAKSGNLFRIRWQMP